MTVPSSNTKIGASDDDHRSDLRMKFVKWSIFGVALPLLPLLAVGLDGVLYRGPDGAASTTSFVKILGNGDLLIVAIVIAAAAIGELLFDGPVGDKSEHGKTAALSAFALLVVAVS